MHQSFLNIVESQEEVDQTFVEQLQKRIVSKPISKGTILQRQGEKASKAYYVKKGLLRSYTIDQKGKEHIFLFASEGWFISDIESQAFDLPAELFIDVLEDSEVEVIDRALINEIRLNVFSFQTELTRLFNRIAVLQKRVIMLLSAPAIDRYEHFLNTYPQLINRVPQKMIASYLGVTPEALSNIKAAYIRKS